MTPEPSPPCQSGLYQRLLGEAWWQLHDNLRRFHRPGSVHACGRFRVRRGSGWLVRLLAKLARVPEPGAAVAVTLAVTPQGTGEEWRRHFAGRPFVTWQFERPGALLGERIRFGEFRFRLTVVAGSLRYETTRFFLCLGLLRVPLPSRFRPCVTAHEKPGDAPNRNEILVDVRLPLLGLVVTYEGTLTLIEKQE